ncbi:MAG: hypothetical protein AAFX78_00515 [Cyanobacteria bacterium J06638_20]
MEQDNFTTQSQSAGDISIAGDENATAFVTATGQTTVDQSRHHTIINYYYRETVTELPAESDKASDDLPCPYRGLFHFGPDDAEFFFGREVFVSVLTTAVEQRSFIPILGASGSGKSSVVLAGLVPQLQRRGHWQFTHFRPGAEPFHALATALVPLLDPELDTTNQIMQARQLANHLKTGAMPLTDVIATIQSRYPQDRILLIADQFEELYTLGTDDVIRNRFLDCLLTSLSATVGHSSSPPLVLVATMRADFLGNALAYRPFADVLQNGDIKLGAMNPEELTQVIEQPALKLGVEFEDGLVNRILQDVKSEPGNLPLLEFALTELWQRRDKQQLTHQAYSAIGEVQGALARHADTKYQNLSPEEQQQVRRIFIQLVQPGQGTEDTRRRATRSELENVDWSLVKHLADSRLVVTSLDPTQKQETVEVVHEALIRSWGQLRQWMETDREFRVWQDRLRGSLQQWQSSRQDEGALLRGAPLSEAEEMLQARRHDLSRAEQALIEQSLTVRDRQVQREQRRLLVLRSLLAATSVIAIVAVVASVVAIGRTNEARKARNDLEGEQQRAVTARQNAEDQEAMAISQYAQSLYNTNSDRLDALMWAIKAGSTLRDTNSRAVKEQVRLTLQEAVYGVSERNRIRGHDGSIQAVTFSSDGKLLATAGRDNTVRLWKNNGEAGNTLEGHEDVVWSVSFSPDGQLLASASRDGTVRLWNPQDENADPSVLQSHRGDVYSVSFSPNGQILASASEDGTVKIWNREGRLLRTLTGHQGAVNGVSFSLNGQTLASASSDGTIKLWSLNGEVLQTLEGHQGKVRTVAFSPQGDEVATAGDDGVVRIWSVSDGQSRGALRGRHTATIWDVTYSLDGAYLASSGRFNQVKLWQRSSGRELKALEGHNDNGDVWSLSFNPDGTTLATAGRDATVKLWAVNRQATANLEEEILIIQGHQQSVEQAEFNRTGQEIASASWDRTIRLWTLDGEEQSVLMGHTDDVWDVSFNPQKPMLASTGRDQTIRLWSRDGELLQTLEGHTDGIEIVEFSPDGETLASASWDKTAKLWDIDGNQLRTLRGHTAVLESVAFNPKPDASGRGPAIATASWDTTAKLWDADGNELVTLEGHKNPVESVSFSPDGKTVITASWDRTVKLWNLEGRELQTLNEHTGWVRDASFSPNGLFIATASSDRTVRLWQKGDEAFELVKTLWVHNGPANSVRFSRDGQYLVSSDTSGRMILGPVDLDMDTDALLKKACSWLEDYLQNGFDVSEADRQLCSPNNSGS